MIRVYREKNEPEDAFARRQLVEVRMLARSKTVSSELHLDRFAAQSLEDLLIFIEEVCAPESALAELAAQVRLDIERAERRVGQ